MTRILLTGGSGQIGWELREALAPHGSVIAPTRGELDLARPTSIRDAIRAARPDFIVNAAAFSSMDEAAAQPELAMLVNSIAPGVIAEEARRAGAFLVHYSSAYVFDGAGVRPYREDDPAHPINAYGTSKLAGERTIAAAGAEHVILRLSWIYSLRGKNFLTAILRLARERRELPVVDDQIGSPTWARTVARVTARLLAARPAGTGGTFHLSAAGSVSRYGFAREILDHAARRASDGAPPVVLRAIDSAHYPLPALRPRYCVLDNARFRHTFGFVLPDWRSDLRDCMAEGHGAG